MPLALIINELLMNAAKYGANQHGQVTITVGFSRCPGLYELCVQDEGLGFDLDPSSRLSGLGLVGALAQRLGGLRVGDPLGHRARRAHHRQAGRSRDRTSRRCRGA